MGFFSRLFPPRDDGRAAADDWTSLPQGESSALALPAGAAAQLLTSLDIDQAIASHARWVPWLEQALHGVVDAQLQPEVIEREDCSELGQWLRGSGQQALGHLPAFDMLVRRNRFFHTQAAEMLTLIAADEPRQAEQAFKACRHASTQVVLLLKELRRGLVRNS